MQFGSPEWDLGYRMASLLVERVPSIEKIRFAVSGTENNQIALRLARTFTGRSKIAKMAAGYHGVADQLLVANGIAYDPNPVPAGVLRSAVDEVIVLPYNDGPGTQDADRTPRVGARGRARRADHGRRRDAPGDEGVSARCCAT